MSTDPADRTLIVNVTAMVAMKATIKVAREDRIPFHSWELRDVGPEAAAEWIVDKAVAEMSPGICVDVAEDGRAAQVLEAIRRQVQAEAAALVVYERRTTGGGEVVDVVDVVTLPTRNDDRERVVAIESQIFPAHLLQRAKERHAVPAEPERCDTKTETVRNVTFYCTRAAGHPADDLDAYGSHHSAMEGWVPR